MNKKRTILMASFLILAALVFAGTGLAQALIVGTGGQPGDNSQTIAPITASQENGDTSVSGSAGHGDGNAATAGTQKDGDSGNVVLGCLSGSAANGDDGGSAGIGNCGGSGSAANGGLDNGTAGGGGGTSLGCIVAELFGQTEGGAQVGSCEAAGGGNEGGGGDNGGGVAGAEAGGGAGVEGGTAPGGGQRGDKPCATIEQASALMGSGTLPLWAFGVAALAAFGGGTVFSRRRRKGVDLTG